MDTERARELIEKAEHVLILLPKEPTFDCLAAGETLSRVFGNEGKRVGFLGDAPTPPHPEFFSTIASRTPPLKEFIISLDTRNVPVGELRYETHTQSLDIILSPKSTLLSQSHLSFREGKVQCNAGVAVGIPSREALSVIMGGANFPSETPLINIDVSKENTRYGTANLVVPERRSLSEIVASLLSSLTSTPLEGELATLLLAGIMSATDGFRSPSLPAETFLTASELVRKGAKLEGAFSLVRTSRPLALVQLLGRAQVRSKMDQALPVLWSCLTREDFVKTGRGAGDIGEVLAHLSSLFPQPRAIALLWEDPEEGTVHASLAGEEPLLDTIRRQAPILTQSPCVTLAVDFPTFLDGETHLAVLLREVL